MATGMRPETQQMVEELINKHKIVVFMKVGFATLVRCPERGKMPNDRQFRST